MKISKIIEHTENCAKMFNSWKKDQGVPEKEKNLNIVGNCYIVEYCSKYGHTACI